ncbi:MAG TPA: TrmH family RNA methyltransferase [Thermoanaerobaculia bacterium]|nr:TrmH family RNA methyltransferase [Thermoanaerobaculia bacterium]
MDRGPAVVLVRPRTPGNLGSVARAARNFGVTDVRLVEPACEPDEEAVRLASGADEILGSMRRFAALLEAVADIDAVIATSSLRGRAERRRLTLRELPEFLGSLGPEARLAYVFGPERSGLTEEERSRASATLTLPTDSSFPTMNLSHALAVILAVHRAFARPAAAREEELAPSREVEAAVEHWDRALEAIGFFDTGHRERSLRDWRRIVVAHPLSMREVAILRGVANRILVSLSRR